MSGAVDGTLTRRGALAGLGGLLIGLHVPMRAAKAAVRIVEDVTGPFAPNAFIRVDTQGVVTFIMRNVEMGQGIYTGATVLMAEELDLDPETVQLEAAPPGEVYVDKDLGTQATGGSTSTMGEWELLRKAAATARILLIQAAANRWQVTASTCRTDGGRIYHDASNRSLGFGEVALDAARLPSPSDVPLRPASAFKLIGRSRHRLDSPAKVAATAQFGIDAQVPGMKFATVAACPVIGGTVGSIDIAAAKAVPGVIDVLKIDDAVCVVGEHYWAARSGLRAAAVTWHEGANAQVDTAQIYHELHQGLAQTDHVIEAHKEGDAKSAVAAAHTQVAATFQQSLLAHATMEPINCTVRVTADACDIWCGTQVPLRARDSAAAILGLPKDSVHLHNMYIGGGFGRRLEHEYVEQAVHFARQVSYPLKIVWSREEDITRDRFRPAYVDRIEAGLSADGRIVGMTHRIVGPAVVARWAPEGLMPNGMDSDLLAAAADVPYDFGASYLDYVRKEAPGVITAWWRGVGGTRGLFVMESFMDELAEKAGADPVEFRRRHLAKSPRALGVLNLVADKAGWGMPVPKGSGRGVAVQFLFGSYLATVVDVHVAGDGSIRIDRAVSAVDCGQLVNPDQVRAQIEGGLMFGMSAAMFNEITLEHGRVQQRNFNRYRVLRMNEAPQVEVHFVDSAETPGGIGETGTAAAAPALANALAAATGRRYRRLPLMGKQELDA